MIKKILIANRGEIALRIVTTARKMGIKTVAIYSNSDAASPHVLACDEAIGLEGLTASETYLDVNKILNAAKLSGAGAIHPGYGFLSENADFAKQCIQAGLIFIGPTPEAMTAMGLKSHAKEQMMSAGVPTVPGYHGENQDPLFLHQQADAIGYPVMIKASAGGGGRGMRVVRASSEFLFNLESCTREASVFFGDASVLLERYLDEPRHIEVQIFGDRHGNCVHLFERDCSIQRRHQKVIEEAPAPNLSEETRKKLGDAAVSAAKAVNYVGAGTVEFIAQRTPNDELDFFFMEMNTRLQVEHPVTEAITGLDLVEWQILVASGEPLPKKQAELAHQGCSIEVRICAENPRKDFLPSVGKLHLLSFPTATHFELGAVRVDSGYQSEDWVSPYFDSMLAKVIVHAPTRNEAIYLLDQALSKTKIIGVANNVSFLRNILMADDFVNAKLDTGFIGRHDAYLMAENHVLPCELAVAASMAYYLQQKESAADQHWQDPWGQKNNWRLGHAFIFNQSFNFEVGQKREAHQIKFSASTKGDALCQFQWPNDVAQRPFSWHHIADERYRITVGGVSQSIDCYEWESSLYLFSAAGSSVTRRIGIDDIERNAAEVGAALGLGAPMSGKILTIDVRPGESIQKGQRLAVLEAMKMEHVIAAPYAGKVLAINFTVGEQVQQNALIVELAELCAP